MPEIKLENITKRWGKFFGVDNVSLDIPDNSFITLLGPSGCGKTTILRMIAGLETPTEGRITIGDKVVFDSNAGINVPANKRKVGFLFQNYALWPNMTVYENISFGLKNIDEELPQVDVKAKQASDMIRALKTGVRIKEVVEECRDKNGKLDEGKALIKLIDTYTMSIYTAKELMGLGVHTSSNPEDAAANFVIKYEGELETIKKNLAADGKSLNEKFEILKDGKVLVSKRKLTKEEIDSRVRACSRIVKIGMFMDRYPAELSGGQQQRVAIARTLAPEPQVLFMDEPLSNLDAKLRLEMRYELQRLHVETGSTFVYVTHDQMEAMTLATKICLVNNGVLQQYAPPLTVYNRPSNLFVADFVGNPSMNFVDAKGIQEADGNLSLTILGDIKAKFVPEYSLDMNAWRHVRDQSLAEKAEAEKQRLSKKGAVEKSNKDEVFRYHVQKVEEVDESLLEDPIITDEDFVLGIRPEAIDIDENGGIDTDIYGAMPTGMESTLKLRVGDFLLTSVIFGGVIYQIGQKEKININGNDILLFDRKSGRLICAGHLEI
ncbi:ABC-type Fe3+/spermidine/putrescine transport systems, ATPase components [Pseudobutyrivibrio sp. YE44]|uniref:ABC transporter ATP-binding protein n=1 Tax=Pseudobutyrivibrio sp. YE44 TaxID=1520802 RepID=UPI0008879193|nr:ABC transporter ATP-binding protein [Pseudobutyrivibrio sp. YE44]SDB42925.1 ABC-type Fe3+/spermidine/putrescine transport systems, ATPase components [Pseudobutyrivibrio sp. YE44]